MGMDISAGWIVKRYNPPQARPTKGARIRAIITPSNPATNATNRTTRIAIMAKTKARTPAIKPTTIAAKLTSRPINNTPAITKAST